MRNLHFVDSTTRGQVVGKAWKLRRVVQVLQKTFRSSWHLGSTFSFDTGVLPSSSKRNTTRTYMPDKPYRWGTKKFMACDSKSSYCYKYMD